MYYLMNKDVIAASFHKENNRWSLSQQNSELPLGRFEINGWLEDRKNKDFEPLRVHMLETMVNRQIDAILKGEILYTKDVFVPKGTIQEINVFDNAHELKAASALAARLKETDYFSSVMEEIKEDNHVCVIATLHENEEFVNLTIHIDSMDISCDKNGFDISIDQVSAELGTFSESYEYVCRVVDDLSFG